MNLKLILQKLNPIAYISYNSIHMTFWKNKNFRDAKQINSCQGFGVRGAINCIENTQRDFQDDETVVYDTGIVDI